MFSNKLRVSSFPDGFPHRVLTPPCLCATTGRRVLCSMVSVVHRVHGIPCPCFTMTTRVSMFRRLCSPPCLCLTVSVVHRIFVPPGPHEGSVFHCDFGPPCLCSIVSVVHRVYVLPCLCFTQEGSMFHCVFSPLCLNPLCLSSTTGGF